MSWRQNFSEGFYRIALTVGWIGAIFLGFMSWVIAHNLFYVIIWGGVGFAIGFAIILLVHWILKGFVG